MTAAVAAQLLGEMKTRGLDITSPVYTVRPSPAHADPCLNDYRHARSR